MQSWNPASTGSSSDNHGNWPGYGFPDQNGSLDDASQAWGQAIPGQSVYSSIDQAATNGAGFYPATTHPGGHLLGDGLNGASSLASGNFAAAQVGLSQYQDGSDFLGPPFDSISQDLFGQDKLDLGELDDFSPVQHHQRQPSAQNFQQSFSFPSENDHSFQSPLAFTPQPMSQPQAHQGNAQQAYEMVSHPQQAPIQQQQQQQHPQKPQQQQQPPAQQQKYQHQAYPQPSQPPQQQQQQPGQGQMYAQSHVAYPQTVAPQQKLSPAPLGQAQPQYTQSYIQHHASPFSQPTPSQSPVPLPLQRGNLSQGRNVSGQIPSPASGLQSPAPVANTQGTKRTVEQAAAPSPSQASVDSNISTEPAAKKRKRATKKVTSADADAGDSQVDSPAKVPEQPIDHPSEPFHPTVTGVDHAALDEFQSLLATGRTRFPNVPAAPYLISRQSIKLPSEYNP